MNLYLITNTISRHLYASKIILTEVINNYLIFMSMPLIKILFVFFMVFNATFNNISVISWSGLLVEETGGPENHRPVASHWQTLSQNVVHLALIEIRTHISGDRHLLQVVVNPTITATTAPLLERYSADKIIITFVLFLIIVHSHFLELSS